MYMFEDACRSKRERLFETFSDGKNYKKKYSAICAYFEEMGLGIFNQEIRDKYNTFAL